MSAPSMIAMLDAHRQQLEQMLAETNRHLAALKPATTCVLHVGPTVVPLTPQGTDRWVPTDRTTVFHEWQLVGVVLRLVTPEHDITGARTATSDDIRCGWVCFHGDGWWVRVARVHGDVYRLVLIERDLFN